MNTSILPRILQKAGESSFFKKLLLPVIVLVFFTSDLLAQSANIVVAPASTTVAVGGSFTVSLRIEVLTGDVDAAEAHLDFDNTKLTVTAVAPSPGSPLGSQALALPSIATINADGHLHYAAFTLSNFPTTSFNLVDVTFSVAALAPTGPSPLTITTVVPHQSDVTRSFTSILNAITNGTVNITAACTVPTATISSTATCNGQAFDLVLQSATGVGDYDLTINGNTYINIPVGGTITTVTPPGLSLWAPGDTPALVDQNDGDDIEVGTKFSSSVDGFVKGIRFYKGAGSTGTFQGRLYDFATQTQLATATFVTTPSGWQEVLFTTPVQITAGTVYVAATYSADGFYSVTDLFFNGLPLVNGPLTAPSGDNSTGITSNGLYAFGGAAPGFPTSSFQNAGYFVDVVFTPEEYVFNLTAVTDDAPCTNNGTPNLQTLTVTSIPCVGLPVTLLNLSASPEGNKITVRWATSTELNNKGFEIQRSLDGSTNWQSLGFVNGAGNSTSVKNYSYVDGNLVARRYFYQLKQVDIDNRYKYSAVVSAIINGKDGFSLEQNFPNPIQNQSTTIRFTLPRKTTVTLSIYDLSGRMVKTLVSGSKDGGTHAIPFDRGSLTAGVYYYKLQADGFTDTKKMTIQ